MDIDELKSSWQNLGDQKKNQKELQMMMKLRNHPKLKRIRVKLIIEILLLFTFLLTYYDFFDGENKSAWINVILVSATVLFVANDFYGFLVLRSPIKEYNLLGSLQKLVRNLQRLTVLSLITSLILGLAVILFFSSTIEFTNQAYYSLAIIILFLLIFLVWSFFNWRTRIRSIKKQIFHFTKSI